jgi:tetratricopeptide (TPR) repeat protein
MKIKALRPLMHYLSLLIFIVFLSSCATNIQAGGDVAKGREALFRNDYQTALTYFESAAQTDPNYVFGTELREGTLSFLGRAQYLNGQLAPAQGTLQKALAQHKSDNLARIYLGLTQARQGNRDAGLRDIENGMKGVNAFLNYITTQFAWSFGQFWDPGGAIRKNIDSQLATIASRNFDWAALIASSETLAMNVEYEEERARRDEEQQIMDQNRR